MPTRATRPLLLCYFLLCQQGQQGPCCYANKGNKGIAKSGRRTTFESGRRTTFVYGNWSFCDRLTFDCSLLPPSNLPPSLPGPTLFGDQLPYESWWSVKLRPSGTTSACPHEANQANRINGRLRVL
ncbi:hypothetical protein T484DRAFT_3564265 [Baffinella frigidus]|nr:hypothetical protein T484DRAFT_3564265 [Cryptophyta sp. CCMP2293]